MGAGHLREGDADLLWELVQDARHDDPGTPVPWALLEGLQRLIPCDENVSFQHHDYGQLRTLLIQGVDGGGDRATLDGEAANAFPDSDLFWQLWWTGSCSWPQRTGDLHSVRLSTDDFPTERDRLADPFYEYAADLRYGISVSLPAPPGEARRFEFMRVEGPPFSERDRELLTLLRPHLIEICLHAERRRAGVPPLTPREWEVLALAGAGLPYDDIARQLVVSRGTVRKHMENVRTRLGVHSIGAAVALALPHAPSAPSPPRRRQRLDAFRTG
jgi:DNA-binding CsgD family transcriptional regulator